MLARTDKSTQVQKLLEEKRIEEERMHEVSLLLQNLIEREERSIKMVISCLYDVGTVNIINNKFRARPLNRTLKSISRMSKPAAKVAGYWWFKRNCPQLITDWLLTKVTF